MVFLFKGADVFRFYLDVLTVGKTGCFISCEVDLTEEFFKSAVPISKDCFYFILIDIYFTFSIVA